MKITPIILLSTFALINAKENAKKKLVCYYTNWSSYRKEDNFTPKDIQPFLCTHVIYSFMTFKDDMTGIKSSDTYQDITRNGFKEFTALKNTNPELKLLVALGGWNEGSKRFSSIAASEEKCRSFAKGTVEFLLKENFDGITIDWQFPGFRDGSRKEDIDNFVKLLKTMREIFDAETNENKLILTITVPKYTEYIDNGYNLSQLQLYVDFINIVCYDYHLSTDLFVNHHSPIYALPGEDELNSKLNMDWTVKYILRKGVPNEKLVLGIPAYGRTYTLKDENMHKLGSPSDGERAKGISTREDGSKAYYEICNDLQNDFEVVYANETAVGPYAHRGKDWIGYDDEKSAKRKGEYARDNNLGGIMLWAIDDDDFQGKCGQKYPLINAAKQGFYSDSKIVTKKPVLNENQNKKVVCYYKNWSSYREGENRFTPKDIQPFLCTHLIYSFMTVRPDLKGIESLDTNQDITKNGFEEFAQLKNTNPDIILLVAVGGWNDGSKQFSPLAASETKRREFARGTVGFLKNNSFDGINIDWEFPAFRDGGTDEDAANFVSLLKDIREVFDSEPRKLWLTISVPVIAEYIDKGFDLPNLQKYADFLTILSYNYHLSTELFVNHHSPIYSVPGEDKFFNDLNTDWTVNYILSKGVPKEKLVLGIPAYGITYALEDENMHGYGSRSAGKGAKGVSTNEDGSKAYYEICNDIIRNGWDVVYVNETAVGPYAHKGKDWVGYDDEKSAKRKGEYARDRDLGGIMFWTIDDDDFLGKCGGVKNPLITAAKEGFYSDKPRRNSPLPKPRCDGFLCKNFNCITSNKKCDGINDCKDNSDEIDCPVHDSRLCTLPTQIGGGSYTTYDCQNPPCDLKPGFKIDRYQKISVNCTEGYALINEQIPNEYICFKGQWHPQGMECIKLCPPLLDENVKTKCVYKGETVNCNDYTRPGTLVYYKCRKYYKIKDPYGFRGHTKCLSSGYWHETLPICIPECGVAKLNDITTRISGGVNSQYGNFPWHVGIFRLAKYNQSYVNICGGSLIHPHMVLSAAHCFIDPETENVIDPSLIAVAGGKVKRDWFAHDEQQESMTGIIKIIIRDTYLGRLANYENDIAIVNLPREFKLNDFILPVCIDYKKRAIYPPDSLGSLVGWGLTEKGDYSEHLQEIHMPYIERIDCIKRFTKFANYITADKFCIVYKNVSGAGQGDSGGGMTFTRRDIHFIYGIISLKTAKANLFSALTNVTIHTDWIRDTIKTHSRVEL